jgi:serine/threonine protein kinase
VAFGALEKGATVAGYRVDGILGHGGMGVVYEATQLSLERVVALKLLAPHLSDDLGFVQRFRREGQIQAAIDHPHIVTVYDSGQSEHGFFIAMRLVRGANLKDLIVARQLDAGRTLRIVSPVAEALDTAHAAGLIHRDIKPQNILVSGRDHSFLADFGLTKATGEESLTKTGQFVGTLDYISPEQIRGERAVVQSDVYSLAAVVYECLTGVVPFPKESEAAVLYAHMADPPPRVTDQRPELPARLDEVLASAMAKEPSQRPASAGALLLEINRAFTRRMRAAFTPPGPIEVPEETGIRPAEGDVPTREREHPQEDLPPDTRPGAVEADAPAPPETRPTPEPSPAPPATAPPTPAPVPATPAPVPPAAAPAPDQRLVTPWVTQPAAGERVAPVRHEPRGPAATPGRIALAAGLLLALAVVGFLLGRGGSDEQGSDSQPVAAGPLTIDAPTGWRPAGAAFAVPGLTLDDGVTLAPGGDPGNGAMAAGVTGARNASLLPAPILKRLGGAPSKDDAVELGELEAYRYPELRPKGFGRALTVYVAPTTEGVATVACAGPSGGGDGFLDRCESAATTLGLVSGTAFPLGGGERYSKKLNATFDKLNAARRSQVTSLRRASTPGKQAAAADRLASAYRRAARSIGNAVVSPELYQDNSRIVGSLGDAGSAYAQLAAAARHGNRARYREAKRRAETAETRARRALRFIGG